MENAPHFYAVDRVAWRQWLEQHHTTETGVWLVYDKGKNRKLKWEDIVQEALCFGWIDSRPGKISETQSKIYVSRRKPKSVWSKINKQHIENLQAAGLMMPAGLEAVKVGKQNGSWDALNRSDNLELPTELAEGLAQNPVALKNFNSFSVSSRKMILSWIYEAKRDETFQKRVEQTIRMAQKNLRANHDRDE